MSDSKHRRNAPPASSQAGAPRSPQSASSSKAASPSHALPPAPSSGEKAAEDKSGRVTFDSKGNPVWEWQTAPGVFEQDVTTQRLKKLEAPELSLATTQPVPTIGNKGSAKSTKSKEDTGFNPYDSDGVVKPRSKTPIQATHPALAHKKPPPARRPEPPKEESMWDKFKSKFS